MTVDAASAGEAFAHTDLDCDGYLTREEYVALMKDFYTSDDPDVPAAWLFGNAAPQAD